MAAKFLNLQLISSRRFAPGSHDKEEKKEGKGWMKRGKQEKATPPWPPESIVAANDQEHEPDNQQESMAMSNYVADRFSSQEEITTHSAETGAGTTGKANPHGQDETLQEIIALESGATIKTATRRELNELKRRRHEVMRQLHELRTAVEQEREALEAKVHFFTTLLTDLKKFPEEIDESALRQLRQAVNSAHIECVKFEQEREQKTVVRNGNKINNHLASLSFGQLSRIGGALFWPLIAALLLTGGIIAITIYIIFRI